MHSCEADVTSLRALARITQPLLYMTGSTAERVELHGLTHRGPVTSPVIVNREVERFLQRTAFEAVANDPGRFGSGRMPFHES